MNATRTKSRLFKIYVLSDGRYEIVPEDEGVKKTLMQQASAGVLAFFGRILPSLKKRPLSHKQEFVGTLADLYNVIYQYEQVRKNLPKAEQKVQGVSNNPLPGIEDEFKYDLHTEAIDFRICKGTMPQINKRDQSS